jgi:hypothetical protein
MHFVNWHCNSQKYSTPSRPTPKNTATASSAISAGMGWANYSTTPPKSSTPDVRGPGRNCVPA